MLDPQSPEARSIADLFNFTMLVALAIVALIIGLVLYVIVRFRHKPGQPDPPPVFGVVKLEIAWTVAPLLIVIFLTVLVVFVFRSADPAVGEAQGVASAVGTPQPDIVLVGHQWWWEVQYPKSGFVTANEIHIPARKKMVLRLESADVIHDFWVPQLSRKMDLTPGHPTQMLLEANFPGTYLGACAEYCGTQHAWMRLKVIAQSQADFDAWTADQSQPPPLPASGQYAQGLQLYKSKTCISCHALGQLGKQVGPNLSHLGSRTTIGAGILTNTPDNLSKWIKNPQDVKPGVLMPNVQLTDSEVNALVAYLESLK